MLTQRSKKMIKATAGVAGLLAGALVMVPGNATAAPAVAASDAGKIEIWGATGIETGVPDRATYAEGGRWSAMALGNGGTNFAINTDGSLVRLSGTVPALNIPAELASTPVKAVSTYATTAAVVTADGGVQVWGTRGPTAQTLTAANLGAPAVDVAVGTSIVTVLLEDGRVGLVSSNPYKTVKVDGADLTNAVEITQIRGENGAARLEGGGIVSFTVSGITADVPAELSGEELADPVVSFAGVGLGVAVTEAGVVHTWGPGTTPFPVDSVDGKVVEVAASSRYFVARTDQNEVVVWGDTPNSGDYSLMTNVPDEVDGEKVVDLVGGVYTFGALVTTDVPPVTVSAKPSIAGAVTVGATLTGTPATFAGSPDSIANRWLANGEAITGATDTTYKLTSAELGKNITFESTATRSGTADVSSLSDPVGPVVAAPDVAVASTTTVSAPARTYGSASSVTVTVGNTAGKPVAGTVTLSGAGAAQTAAVAGGQATFVIDKALAAGSYALTAAYSGSAGVNPSAGATTFTVAKAKSGKPAFKANKVSTSKKKGKATVTVGTGSGLAKATGKATVTIKKGKTTKKITVTLSNGKKSISLPKLKKGTWKVQVSYNGDKNYVAQKSKSYNLKIKK